MPPNHLRNLAAAGADFLRDRLGVDGREVAFIQTGTGFDLAGLLDQESASVSLNDLPGMPDDDSPAGHRLRLIRGRCGQNRILLCQGRRHWYEGHGMAPCVLPACSAALCGIPNAVFLCATGGIREDLKPGTLVAVTDFINNLGTSPLTGNLDLGHTPFPDMTHAFSQQLLAGFVNAAAELGLSPRLGVYQANAGPQYETPAEIEVARRNGADVVGMSLVPETIAAHTLEMRVLGLALVANTAAGHGGAPIAHQDVVEACHFASDSLRRALRLYLRSEIA